MAKMTEAEFAAKIIEYGGPEKAIRSDLSSSDCEYGDLFRAYCRLENALWEYDFRDLIREAEDAVKEATGE